VLPALAFAQRRADNVRMEEGRETMSDKPAISLSHAGFHVFDMDGMVRFFTEVYGLKVVDSGPYGDLEMITFLSADPRDHHQLVLYSGRKGGDGAVHHNHVSFRADGLARLREIHRKLQAWLGVTRIQPINHGVAWSVYCHDPEGNRTEVFVDTPWYVAQPFGEPLDLEKSDEEIHAVTEAMLKDNPTARPFEEWRADAARHFGAVR
jgi:catechol 2,3-dioxygenase